MSCPCRICKLPNAKDIWDVVNKRGKNEGQRQSGLARSTFYSTLKVHAAEQQGIRARAVAAPVVVSVGPQPDPEPLFPQDPKTMDPEDLLWLIHKELSTIGRNGKPTDQVRTTALKEARETVLGIQKLRSSKVEDVTDPNKVDAELQKTLLEKLDTYLPVATADLTPPTVVTHTPSPGVEAGLVH